MIEMVLPYPPSVNTYWRHVGSRVLISKAGREYKKHVAFICYQQRIEKITGTVFMQIDFYPPDRRRRDIDNVLKPLLDAIEGWTYADDSQILKLTIEKFGRLDGGKCVVRLEQLERKE